MSDYVPEWERFRVVARRCACRGAVVVTEVPGPQAVLDAVVSHQDSAVHREWTDRGGMEATLDAGTFDVRLAEPSDALRSVA